MKKIHLRLWLIALAVLAALATAGCDDPDSEPPDPPPSVRGVWDLSITPEAPSDKEYIITVEKDGGFGQAVVSVTGPLYSDSALVQAGASIDVGDCNVWIAFGSTTGFNLAAGDYWRLLVSNGQPNLPLPGETIDSLVGPVVAGGQDNCAAAPCPGSAMSSAVPGPTKGLIAPAGQGREWLSTRLGQNNAQVSANVPEQQVLSLYLGTVAGTALLPIAGVGTDLTLSYRRAMEADGAGGDFFRVMIVNGTEILDAEYLFGTSVAAADTTVSLTFTVKSPELRVDFVAGLSDQGESVRLDLLGVTGGIAFTEGFEPTAGICDTAVLDAGRFERRLPSWTVGSLRVSATGALDGVCSARWQGGSYRQVTGSIITGAAVSGISSFLGGGMGSLLGGADVSALAGIFMEAWEPTWTGYLTSFSVARQGASSLLGTYKGESPDHICVEQGQITGSLHQTQTTDLSSSFWIMRIEGAGVNCLPALAIGNTLEFGDTLTTASGDTILLIQIGGLFLATATNEPIDNYGNTYRLSGTVGGSLVTFALAENTGASTANGAGLVSDDRTRIQGVLTGRLTFDFDAVAGQTRVCELSGTAFQVDLVAP